MYCITQDGPIFLGKYNILGRCQLVSVTMSGNPDIVYTVLQDGLILGQKRNAAYNN